MMVDRPKQSDLGKVAVRTKSFCDFYCVLVFAEMVSLLANRADWAEPNVVTFDEHVVTESTQTKGSAEESRETRLPGPVLRRPGKLYARELNATVPARDQLLDIRPRRYLVEDQTLRIDDLVDLVPVDIVREL